jgi:hypothetical protein
MNLTELDRLISQGGIKWTLNELQKNMEFEVFVGHMSSEKKEKKKEFSKKKNNQVSFNI